MLLLKIHFLLLAMLKSVAYYFWGNCDHLCIYFQDLNKKVQNICFEKMFFY